MKRIIGTGIMVAACLWMAGCAWAPVKTPIVSPAAKAGGPVVFKTAMASDADPFAAGRKAAEALKAQLGGAEPHLILVAEVFEDRLNKEKAVRGVASVFGRDRLVGGSSYGMFSQDGVMDRDAVSLLAVAGEGIAVRAALVAKMGAAGLTPEQNQEALTAALGKAGAALCGQLPGAASSKMMILISDAHSPKNQLLLDGVQSAVGKTLPVTGGSVNKNAGQNWVIYRGRLVSDAAVAVVFEGGFRLAFSGMQANENDKVVSTAREAVAAAKSRLGGSPALVLAYDCGGRKGKLIRLEDERAAMIEALGRSTPLFGVYCAGEFGNPEDSAACSVGRGWHVMVTAFGTEAK